MRTIAFVVVLTLSFSAAADADTISNLSIWDKELTGIGPWNGSTSTLGGPTTYGETFLATGTDSVLTSFMFENGNASGSPLNYLAEVSAWDGTNLVGPVLFIASPSTIDSTASGDYLPTTISTGDLNLTAGTEYIAFFTTVGQNNASSAFGDFGYTTQDVVADSGLYYNYNTTAQGLDTAADWIDNVGGELAFSLEFADVPEPSAWVLMAGPVVLLAMLRYRHRARNLR